VTEPSDPSAGSLPPRPSGPVWRQPSGLALAGVAIAVFAAAVALAQWQRSGAQGRETARRLQQSDERVVQLEAQVKQAQDQARDLQSRSAVLESKLTEALGQQAQLERMYRDLAADGIDAVLADVENSVAIASQQLLVSGNVQGALAALQEADVRLRRINQPQALGLRRLIARDLDRLRALPAIDIVGMALRLDSVAGGIDQLPLLAGLSAPAPERRAAAAGDGDDKAGGFSFERLASTGRRGWEALLGELSTLFRVNRVDADDALLLAPEQRYFVRENLRLTLLSARLALLARAEPVFRSDLERAVGWLETYYERQSRAVANAIATLRQLQSARIAQELPSLGDTLAAVRAARSSREGTP
jgi:uroporphyrin-3 C-methyltransferase/uroporphyrinogen III methyltransferase/synthase